MTIFHALSLSTILFFALTIITMSTQINGMECSEMNYNQHRLATCQACRIPYTTKYETITGPCEHNLCSMCLLHNDMPLDRLETIYSSFTDFQCPGCRQTIIVGTRKSLQSDSDDYLIEILWSSFSNSESLFDTIQLLAKKRSVQEGAKLLELALVDRNKSLCQIIDVFGYTVLHAACNVRLTPYYFKVQCIKIILGAAGTDAWDLVCKPDNEGNTALSISVNYVINYLEKMDFIKDLLFVAPNDEERWKLISQKICGYGDKNLRSPLEFVCRSRDKIPPAVNEWGYCLQSHSKLIVYNDLFNLLESYRQRISNDEFT